MTRADGAPVVGIDVSPALSGDTGVARYAEALVAALVRRDDVEVRTLAAGRGIRDTTLPVSRRARVPLRVLRTTWRVAGRPRAEDLLGPLDVVHAIDLVPPPTAAPVVITCHDVLPLTHPHLYEARYRRLAQQHVAALRRAAVVLATCRATADEIERVAGVPTARIVVAPPGRRLPAGLEPPAPSADPGPSLLYVGAVTPRKGLHRLVEAVCRTRHRPRLLVAGPDGMGAAEVHRAVDALGVTVDVRWLGRVDDDTLIQLLRGATLLCHPSEAEGFGIPVLEAMGTGTPVLAGDIPPVREVGGDAVALVPPLDIDAWAAAIDDLLDDPDRRQAMSASGLDRSASYTWDATAEVVAGVYRRLTDG